MTQKEKYRSETKRKRKILEAKRSKKIDAKFLLKYAKRIPIRFVLL
jgi:hypothetical protein